MFRRITILAICILLAVALQAQHRAGNEVIYHVFQRSFFDSNGDGKGDLSGIRSKLDYLQELGVTSLLLTPLYSSGFYHNYFADDFETIDSAYGTMGDYAALVREVHRRGMKIYQDVEMQYVSGNHPWLRESLGKPASEYIPYIYWLDSGNRKPFWFYNIAEFPTYDGRKHQIAVVNMLSPEVREYTFRVLSHWVDPDGDGDFADGVDGFRLDHAMDDLDGAGKLTNLLSGFWKPLLDRLHHQNRRLRIIAEQANWGSFGYEYIQSGGVDRVFGFRLGNAIASFNKEKIGRAADSTLGLAPAGKEPVVFLENHDTRRFATAVKSDAGKLRAGAALNLLLGGIPSIYYGQELGMRGDRRNGPNDGNDISIREAFDWYSKADGPGMAYWYRGTGIWWDSSYDRPNDGISLEEERADTASLWHWYRRLLKLRAEYPALYEGRYVAFDNPNPNIFSFRRKARKQQVIVFVNLSDKPQELLSTEKYGRVLLAPSLSPTPSGSVLLPPWGTAVWELR